MTHEQIMSVGVGCIVAIVLIIIMIAVTKDEKEYNKDGCVVTKGGTPISKPVYKKVLKNVLGKSMLVDTDVVDHVETCIKSEQSSIRMFLGVFAVALGAGAGYFVYEKKIFKE